MLQTLLHVFLVLIMINFVIIIHELGHYAAAKLFNIKVNTIAIGFGKVIYRSAKSHKISWQLAMLPLGGYVSMLDNRDKSLAVAQHPYCLNTQAAWKKIIVYLAGPAANIICAIMVYWALLTLGINYVAPEVGTTIPNSIAAQAMLPNNSLITKINGTDITSWKDVNFALTTSLGSKNNITLQTITDHKQQEYTLNTAAWQIDALNFDPITSLGIEPYEPNVAAIIMAVKPNSPAAAAGLKVNDTIIAINSTKILSYQGLKEVLKPLSNKSATITVMRDGNLFTVPVVIGSKLNSNWRMSGYLGIQSPPAIWPANTIKQIKYPLSTAITYALKNTYQIFVFNFTVLTKIITNIIPLTSLSGPLGFIKTSMQALNSNLTIFFEIFAIFNILLAFVNILPMPGLDGGNILFIIYEKITRKELHILWQGLITKFSFIFLAIITIHATINDIFRIID
jgi:regulator of sigma E protease